jgi:hypothetical protein
VYSGALMRMVVFGAALLCAVQPVRAEDPAACTALSGVVRDSTGALVPGAEVTLDGKALLKSGNDGRFRFACVEAGKHAVMAHFDGFANETLNVTTPNVSEVSFRLMPSAEMTMDVDGDETPPQAAGGTNGLVLAGKQLQALADDPDDLLRQLQQLAAASGGSPSATTISVDGFQDDAKLPPKDSIAFINVSPDLFSAEYREPPFGGGGRVEVYTKPGAKTYHGALFMTNSSSWMNARDPFVATTNGPLGKQRYGFDLSGPVEKNGSNFSVSLEHRSIDEVAAVNAFTVDSATGNVVNVLDNVATPQRLWIGQARVDRQLGPKNIAFVTYSANINHLGNVGVGGQTLREAGYDEQANDQTVRFSEVTTVSPKLMHEARLSWEDYSETDTPSSTAPSVQVAGYFTGGGASIGNSRQHRYRIEDDDDFILTTKQQTIKAGVQFFWLHRNSDIETNFNGTYVFAGTQTANAAQMYTAGTPYEYESVSGTPKIVFSQVRFVAFYQDDWKLTPKVTMSYGLRCFLESEPGSYRNLAPRVGFAWVPDKKKTWTLKTHFGIFNGQFSADEVQEIRREDGVERVTRQAYSPVYCTGASGCDPYAGTAPVYSQRTLEPGLSVGRYMLEDVSVSKDLPLGFNINGESVFLQMSTLPWTENINAPLDGTATGPRPLGGNVNILQVRDDGAGQGHGEFVGLSNFKLKRVGFFLGALHLNLRDTDDNSTFWQPQSTYNHAGEEVRRDGQSEWQVFGNANFTLPLKLSLSGNVYFNGGRPFNIVTGMDNNHDGDFNDRPQFAAPGVRADGVTTFDSPWGVLTNTGPLVNGVPVRPIERILGALPWNAHLDANLQRAFKLTKNAKADHPQTLTANLRAANFLNHTNVTAEGNVPGAPEFLQPIAADTARRVELGLRYSF